MVQKARNLDDIEPGEESKGLKYKREQGDAIFFGI